MKKTSSGRPGLLDFVTVPPALSLVIVLLLSLLGGEGPKGTQGLSFLWGAFLLAYVFLAAGDLMMRMKGHASSRFTIQFLCQGIALTALPSFLGVSGVWSWLGLALLSVGLVLSMDRSAQPARPAPAERRKEGPLALPVLSFLEGLPLPAFFRAGEGDGVAFLANEAARDLALSSGKEEQDFFRQALTEETLSAEDDEYEVLQGQGMALTLLQKKQLAPSGQVVDAEGDFDVVFRRMEGRERALLRLGEELARGRRYRRWLSAILIRPDQLGPAQAALNETQRQEVFDLFLAELAPTLRDSDPIFRLAPQDILLLLPETPQAGARKFSTRIKQMALDFKPKLFGLDGASGPFLVLTTGIVFYDGNGPMTPEEFLSQLETSVTQNL